MFDITGINITSLLYKELQVKNLQSDSQNIHH